ncbi:hypothetical protein M514_02311 [Trichuris suis]|uniref:ISXO2-like transposase domain-containing protein n=1 Tax=Trichuris suis TaxID=68888 RepID=A0A085NBG5_9BILA|nr:hypothetical protein M514_02311 [Trichuris suis]
MATVKSICWLYETIKHEETAAQFLGERGLLHSERLCPVCEEAMRLGRGGVAWYRYKRSCCREVSIRTGTWLEGINKSVTARWNRHLQQVLAEALAEAPVQLGRPSRTVKLDESLFPGANPAAHHIQRHVRAGTTVITDEWRAYPCLSREAYTHLRVNYSVNFVDGATGAHTQSVESLWAQAKQGNKRRCGTRQSALPSHLCEFTWRKGLVASDDAFDAIPADILRLHPPRSDAWPTSIPVLQRTRTVAPYTVVVASAKSTQECIVLLIP